MLYSLYTSGLCVCVADGLFYTSHSRTGVHVWCAAALLGKCLRVFGRSDKTKLEQWTGAQQLQQQRQRQHRYASVHGMLPRSGRNCICKLHAHKQLYDTPMHRHSYKNSDWIEQGLTSHSTHFRSFRRRTKTRLRNCV